MRLVGYILAGLMLWSYSSAMGQQYVPPELQNSKVTEHVGEQLPLDLTFQDSSGEKVQLRDLLNGEIPAILTMNYSKCPMLCSTQLTGLVQTLNSMEYQAGQEFRIITVSLDPMESTIDAAKAKKDYLERYNNWKEASGWSFLVGKQSEIKKLADLIGIGYQYVPARKEYAHPAVFALITPDGVISGYRYGVTFDTEELKTGLLTAGSGAIGSGWEKVFFSCFHLDPITGKMALRARTIMKLGGVLIILAMITLWYICHRLVRKKQQATTAGSSLMTPATS